jgi:hypothetical protein
MKLKDYIFLSISTLTLAGCTSEDITNTPDDERIPLRLEATLSGDCPVTRAYDNVFEKDDKLLSYVQHVYYNGSVYSAVTGIEARLVTFTKGSAEMEKDEDSKKKTSDLTPDKALYWDDFSESSSEDKDLRKSDHGLRSFYGYCYNGGSGSLTKETGVLAWSANTDQRTNGIKTSDLLWSKTIEPVTYDHAKETRKGLSIPYTHAMSKFTIVLVAGDGFKAEDLDNATVTLNGMNAKGTFTAPTSEVTVDVPTDGTTTTTVKMYANTASTTADNKPCRAYEAVVVPLTALTKDNLLATIESMSGNTYMVNITDDMLTKWSEKEALNTGKTKSGYNYKLTVTLNKQTVGVVASLANWSDVSAEGTGEIQFSADIKTTDATSSTFAENDAFSLWMATDKDNMGSIATTSKFDGSKFVNSPAIYWPNGSDCYYFRALAKTSSVANKTMDAATLDDVTQGSDILWGTTAAHKGNTTIDYAEGAAINPRTGEVPLVFKHAMSNVVITLVTTDDDSKVVLDKATVSLTKLTKEGTISITDGSIAAGSKLVDEAFSSSIDENKKISVLMVPQAFEDRTSDADNARLIITLENGTTYSIKLNNLTDGTNPIKAWESGNQYNYTITLAKAEMKFSVTIAPWVDVPGSGKATLDWD